jgi:aspartate/tyrosine/aromatic aminotransferase
MAGSNLSARVQALPGDPIFGVVERFKADPRPNKVNLAQGVYMDESGSTPILGTVREAERRLLASSTTKVYKPIAGDPRYLEVMRALLFRPAGALWGELEPAVSGRVEMVQTPGGTGAIRLAVELVTHLRPEAEIWISEPTWPNHRQIVDESGAVARQHTWLSADGARLDIEGLLAAIDAARPGDAMILHASCHNPTGIDPTPAQWSEIAAHATARGILPIIDFAYQGFGDGLVEDAAAVRAFLQVGGEFLVASSGSKNFALYDERIGALAIVGADASAATTLLSHVKALVRTAWSNPPAHGGEIIVEILSDPKLRAEWELEVTAMRTRIADNRAALVAALAAAGAGDWSHLANGRGMFALLNLDDAQIARLRDDHAVYVVALGRLNVAGLTSTNIPVVAKAIAAVVA